MSLEKGDQGKKSYELLACLPGYDDNVANGDQMDNGRSGTMRQPLNVLKSTTTRINILALWFMKREVLIVIMGSSRVIMCSKCCFQPLTTHLVSVYY